MKKLLYFACFVLLCSYTTKGQSEKKDLRERSIKNLSYLTDSKTLLGRVSIGDAGISLLPRGDHRPEFHIYWDEVNHFIDMLESKDYYTLQQVYKNKRSSRFVNMPAITSPPYNGFPTRFEDLRVSLDPGHFGSNIEESWLEGRLVKVKGSDAGQSGDLSFFEADLTYHTALLLKQLLTERGAQVMITRPQNAGAMNKKFSTWLKTSFQEDLHYSFSHGDMAKSFYDTLRRAITDTTRTRNRYNLFQFYKYLDFRERSRKINEFNPNITFVIHFNASEGSRAYGKERYTKPVATNYAMAFVPGSFEYDELEKADQKMDFVRLLLSPDLTNSMRLADLLVRKHQTLLGVPPVPMDSLRRMREVVIPTPYPGVFCRNLYLTRSVRGPVVYGESLYQDNSMELLALSKKDYTWVDAQTGHAYQTSSRCALVAQAYFEALQEFLLSNDRIHTPIPVEDNTPNKQ